MSENKKKEIPLEIQNLLKQVVDHFDQEERPVRERQILLWRKMKLYWAGYTRIWLDSVAHDWRVYDQTAQSQGFNDQNFYDKPVNVFQAYLQSIIAALSVKVPGVICYPDDATLTEDMDTAKAGNKIYELVSRHIGSDIKWLEALYVLCTEGLIAGYNYSVSDEKYGTYEENKIEGVEEEHYLCPICQSPIDELFIDRQTNVFQPNDNDVELDNLIKNDEELICPQCATALDPNLEKSSLIVEKIVGVSKAPKTRQCLDIWGGLYVKVPNYAKDICACPYLGNIYETHYTNAIEWYPELRKSISFDSGTYYDSYERWARLSTQYNGQFPTNLVTMRNFWLRPSAFNILTEEEAKQLKKRFPDGVKVVFANDSFCEACNESLEDHWTLSRNPLSDYVHFDPLGKVLGPIQDITNDLVSLKLQEIEMGIGQTFADPSVINFKAYGEMESTPGMIMPATPKSGKSLSDSIFQLKTTINDDQLLPFAEKINELGQFTSGAMPGIFGGASPSGGNTASEYAMQRAQAQQRLQNSWKMVNLFWKECWGKIIPQHIKCQTWDEKDVKKTSDGRFENVLIGKLELSGKIGRIELDSSEELPVTATQQRDTIMQFMQSGNPEIMEALGATENLTFLAKLIGIPELKLPGMDDRERQFGEIQVLAQQAPILERSSVTIEQLVDDHIIHIEICKSWLKSDAGQLCKVEMPEGYQNVLLHLKEHMEFVALTTPEMGGGNNPSGNDSEPKVKEGPKNQNMASPMKNERNNGVRIPGQQS